MNVAVDQHPSDVAKNRDVHTHHKLERKSDSTVQRRVSSCTLFAALLWTLASCPVVNQQTDLARNRAPLLFVEYVIGDAVAEAHY